MSKKNNKKPEYLILFVIALGFLTLFFFPEPQTNFVYYAATAIFFILIILFLAKRKQ